MIITTARKPSSKTRTFCKHLSRFTGWEYISRGKTGLNGLLDEPFLLVGEYRGNPGSFRFFKNGECVLSIRANVSLDKDISLGEKPVIQGAVPLAKHLSITTGLKTVNNSQRIINVNENIEFICNGVPCIKLKVLGIRSELIV